MEKLINLLKRPLLRELKETEESDDFRKILLDKKKKKSIHDNKLKGYKNVSKRT